MKISDLYKILLFALIYIVLAKVGLLLALDDGFASVVWPGSGLALSFLLISGNKIWPAIVIGAFSVNYINGGSLGFSSLVCFGNTMEAMVAYYILKMNDEISFLFLKLKSIIQFLVAAFIGSIISASIGVFALVVFQKIGADHFETLITWWLGDVTSFLLIVPIVFLFNKAGLAKLKNGKTYASLLLLFAACYATFFRTYLYDVLPMVLVFSLFMFPLIAALTQGRLPAILHVFVISLFAILGTIAGKGPFIYSELNDSLIILQSFISILSIVALIVSVGIKEKETIEDKLSVLLIEKDLLISEIHHRVKNNLSVVSSLLYLQGETIENKEIRKKMDQTQMRIKTIALVHEKLYKNANIKTVEFSDYIKTLAEMIQRLYESNSADIQLVLDIEKVELLIEKAMPLGLIINELLTNSFKHAFNENAKGKIEIKFNFKDGKYLLSVKDNGIGYNVDSTGDFNSLGLTLVNTLADQIDAKFSVKNQEGTVYEFYFN